MRTTHNRFHPLALAALLACLALPAAVRGQVSPQTLPHGATLANGTASITQYSNGLGIINSPGAILNWQSFSIGANRTVQFEQLGASSAVLNRVTGNAASEIMGSLLSNGRVFLLNPNGIVFGAGAVVDTAGLIASTLNISDEDFLAGTYRFRCFNATVCEAGVDVLNPHNNRVVLKDGSRITTRTAGEGGQVWLIARDRITSEKGSRIEAPSGQVMAATAREVTITSPALGQMSFTLTGTSGSRVDLAGDIDVARGAAGFFSDTVRLAGRVSARSDVNAAGQIVARAANEIVVDGMGRLDVSGNDGADAGAVRLKAMRRITIAPASEIAADGGAPTTAQPAPKGGLIELEAYQVSLPWVDTADFETAVGYRQGGHAALHAFARGAASGDYSRHGEVRIQETGDFDYVSTPSGLAFSAAYIYDRGLEQGSGNDNQEFIHTAAQAADGSILVVSSRADDTQTSGSPWTLRARKLVPGGSAGTFSVVLSSGELAPDTGLRMMRLIAQPDGGWLLLAEAESAAGASTLVWMLDGQGAVRNHLNVSEPGGTGAVESAWALREGGFAIRTWNQSGDISTRVFSATGVARTGAADVAAAMAQQATLQQGYGAPGNSEGLGPGYVNFNPWLNHRVTMDDDFAATAWDIVDSRSGAVVWTPPVDFRTLEYGWGGMSAMGTLYAPGSLGNGGWGASTVIRVLGADGQSRGTIGTIESQRSGDDSFDRTTTLRPVGSDTLLAWERYGYSNQVGYETHYGGEQRLSIVQRVARAMPVATTGTSGGVVAPLLLASAPGQANGIREGGGDIGGPGGPGVPPVDPPIDPPVTPPVTPPGNPGGNPSGPSTLEIVSRLDKPLPVRPEEARPPTSTPTEAKPGVSVPAAVVTGPSVDDLGDGGEAEWLEAARDVVFDLLGAEGLAKFDAADGRREQGAVLAEAGYAQTIGRELYDATRDMSPRMRAALFSSMAGMQEADMLMDRDLSEGLSKALTVKRATTNPDGTPGVPRTRLETVMLQLEVELEQAESLAERNRVKARITREMIIGAREEEGETVDPDADVVVFDSNGASMRIDVDGNVTRTDDGTGAQT